MHNFVMLTLTAAVTWLWMTAYDVLKEESEKRA